MGIDDEWMEVSRFGVGVEMLWQNCRCGALFKGINGRAWYLDAVVWKDQDGHTYTGSAKTKSGATIISRQYVKRFPFEPKTFYISVVRKKIGEDDYEHIVFDERHLSKVFRYYDPFND